MTLIQLEYIIALNRYRHFVKAAGKSFVTQPTLSMQIQKLEDELGVQIFDRSSHPVEPTEIGKKIIAQAEIILDNTRKIPEFINDMKNQIKGELKIGIIPTIAPYLIPLFITKIINCYPELQIEIEELLTHQIALALKNNELDMGIISTPLNEKGIKEIPLYYEPFIVFVSENHRFYNKEELAAEDLEIDDMWLLNEGHCFSSQSLNLCGANQIKTQKLALKYRSGSLESLSKLVEQQYGYTLLPWLASLNMDEKRKKMVREFHKPIPKREISIIVKETFLKETIIQLIKKEILQSVPKELLNVDKGMIVNWK